MSERGLWFAWSFTTMLVLLMLLSGCGSYRDSRELVLGDQVVRASSARMPLASLEAEANLAAAPWVLSRAQALQLCLLFPAQKQLQCIVGIN